MYASIDSLSLKKALYVSTEWLKELLFFESAKYCAL